MKKIYQVYDITKKLKGTYVFKEDAEDFAKNIKGSYIEELNF